MTDTIKPRPAYQQLEQQVCDVVAEQLGLAHTLVQPGARLIEDLHCDSLDLVELLMAVEDRFAVTLPDALSDPVYKSVFTRPEFRVRDLAELVHLRWGTGQPERYGLFQRRGAVPPHPDSDGFTQLGGRLSGESREVKPLHDDLGRNAQGYRVFRRRIDGMLCVQIPPAEVTIGWDGPGAMADEQPVHTVRLSSFLMDIEPVSTTAYARFLNSTAVVDESMLRDWFLIGQEDKRHVHQPLVQAEGQWRPHADTETWPMILVSWYGAHAYTLWAHGQDWRVYRELDAEHLPSEAQWEYAARGVSPQRYPWGNREPTPADARFGMHERGRTYALGDLPLTPVQAALGVSPFGLRHMAGNVWHWCGDGFDPVFYRTPEAAQADAVNRTSTGVRSERGGSWIGPAELLRCSYRRARAPHARGRCLGFRCVQRAAE